jgi:hypothetical protein
MTRALTAKLAALSVAVWALLLCVTPTARPRAEALPHRLDDRTFWMLTSEFSEPGGTFRSDNLVSNETVFQYVIPTLQQTLGPVSAYIGVGPDQNFTYIASLEPRIAFIVDIRRQNMMLHLMYKALIEMSPTREAFLTRLFSRPPPNLDPNVTPNVLLDAFARIEPDPVAFERNRAEIFAWLQRRHGFALSRGDLAAIDYVYRAFYSAGPELRYSFGRGGGWQPFPTYRDLVVADDGQGLQRSYLANEALYGKLRDLQERNLVVPVVGDFGGPKALRSVARYLDVHHSTLSVFYTSNVEQYLFRPLDAGGRDAWQRFYDNVAAMPISQQSTFIRAFFNNQGRIMRIPDPQNGTLPVGPRSQTLLNPIAVLLGAYSEGHISNYTDVIELSR